MQKDKYILITLHISLMITHITLMSGYKYSLLLEGPSSTSVSIFKAPAPVQASGWLEAVTGLWHPLPMLMYPLFSPTGIAAWKPCVCVRRTRSTVPMRRELWRPSTRRRGGSERIRSWQAFERWSTERLKAKRKSNASFELCTIASTTWQLTQSSCDLKKAAGATAPFTQQGQASGVDYLYQGKRVIFIGFSWMVCFTIYKESL